MIDVSSVCVWRTPPCRLLLQSIYFSQCIQYRTFFELFGSPTIRATTISLEMEYRRETVTTSTYIIVLLSDGHITRVQHDIYYIDTIHTQRETKVNNHHLLSPFGCSRDPDMDEKRKKKENLLALSDCSSQNSWSCIERERERRQERNSTHVRIYSNG